MHEPKGCAKRGAWVEESKASDTLFSKLRVQEMDPQISDKVKAL